MEIVEGAGVWGVSRRLVAIPRDERIIASPGECAPLNGFRGLVENRVATGCLEFSGVCWWRAVSEAWFPSLGEEAQGRDYTNSHKKKHSLISFFVSGVLFELVHSGWNSIAYIVLRFPLVQRPVSE